MFVTVKPNSFERIVIDWAEKIFPELYHDAVIGGVDFWAHDIFVVHVSPKMFVVKYHLTHPYSFEQIEMNVADPNYFNTLKDLIASQLKRLRLR